MQVQTQFSKSAQHYDEYNIVQQQVVDHQVALCTEQPPRILDLGCGTGALFKSISWNLKQLVAIDFSDEMLKYHPSGDHIELIKGDFNDETLFKSLGEYQFDRIFSASSLQWAKDLDQTFQLIKEFNAPISFSIFTQKTFAKIFETAGINPLLRDVKMVLNTAEKYFDIKSEVVTYRLPFSNSLDMLRYIKASGVSGGRNILNYKQINHLLREYPLDHLEFEVLFIHN